MFFSVIQGRRYSLAIAVVVAMLAGCVAYGSDIVFVDTHASATSTRQEVEAAARVYGLAVNAIVVGDASSSERGIAAIQDPKVLAVILTADALESSYGDQLLSAVNRMDKRKPLMIAGITDKTDSAALAKWSGGAITGAQQSSLSKDAFYLVAPSDAVTRQLGGAKLPIQGTTLSYLTAGNRETSQWLIAASDGTNHYPVLMRSSVNGRPTFFVTASVQSSIPDDLMSSAFLFPVIAPQLLFLSSAAGDYAWHYPGHYANLTIDDLWLRQPYGHVDYYALLQEMQQHNFHTTIAFIPWNYDRSEPAMVALFREHPDRYSICVHGDNHDHQEFGPVSTRPLAGQIKDMKQGLARMAEFQRLTNLPWDPVMVFPHKMSPTATLANLRRYNYWSTVNTINIPSDVAAVPADPEIGLRPATLAFADFPSVRRYSAEEAFPHWLLAMDAFLGNPILLYSHQAFFSDGIGDFDSFADEVNHLQPDTNWSGLGDITQHLYLEKLRDDGNYDVDLFTATARLTNSVGHDAVFNIEKQEDGTVPFTLTVDGQTEPYTLNGGWLRLQVPVSAGATRQISIVYQNDFVLDRVDISKSSWRIAAVRHLSDFRDDVVSRSGAGRWFIRSYVANRSTWNHSAEGVVALSAVGCILWWRSGRKKRRFAHEKSVA